MIQFLYSSATDIGLKRQQNQDSLLANPELGLFAVADGMGGHLGGETASALAVETLLKEVKKGTSKPIWNAGEVIAHAIQIANAAVYDHALEHPELHGMGTTLSAFLFSGRSLAIGHVGDSRCYFVKPGAIWQLTRDHSMVQEKLRAGIITRDQLKSDRSKNVITRSVGFEPELHVDVYEMNIQAGDVFLVCSDGLTGPVEDSEILSILQKHLFSEKNIDRATQELIKAANLKGGEDNVTVIITQVAQVQSG